MNCSITGYCHEHGFWHGGEASELRCGIEKILAEHGDAREGDDYLFDTYRDLCLDVQKLLDCTDARDSLAFEEMKQESGLIIDSDPPPDEEDESDDQIWPRVSAEDLQKLLQVNPPAPLAPIPMRLHCPGTYVDEQGATRLCAALHIDEGEFATKPHHTHSCQHRGMTWRPAVVHTVGVQFLPGFKNTP